jgi:hypothetical protein
MSDSWGAEDDEGVFRDNDSIFGDAEDANSANPLLSTEEDAEMHSPPGGPGAQRGPLHRPVALVAVFDDNGEPLVAKTVMENGKPKQLEEYRRPTPDEYNALMWDAKIVRGGVVGTNVPTTTNLQPNMQKTPLGMVPTNGVKPWKKWALLGGVGIAAIGGGYFIYKKVKAED